MATIGTAGCLDFAPRMSSSTWAGVVPEASERTSAAWIDLPSAIGSEKGIPTSTMSAPPLTTASITEAEVLEVWVAAHHVRDEGALSR